MVYIFLLLSYSYIKLIVVSTVVPMTWCHITAWQDSIRFGVLSSKWLDSASFIFYLLYFSLRKKSPWCRDETQEWEDVHEVDEVSLASVRWASLMMSSGVNIDDQYDGGQTWEWTSEQKVRKLWRRAAMHRPGLSVSSFLPGNMSHVRHLVVALLYLLEVPQSFHHLTLDLLELLQTLEDNSTSQSSCWFLAFSLKPSNSPTPSSLSLFGHPWCCGDSWRLVQSAAGIPPPPQVEMQQSEMSRPPLAATLQTHWHFHTHNEVFFQTYPCIPKVSWKHGIHIDTPADVTYGVTWPGHWPVEMDC